MAPTKARTPVTPPAESAAPARLTASVVVNAPTHQNSGGTHENRVTHYANEPADKTAGANATMAAHAFEARVSQEQGTH